MNITLEDLAKKTVRGSEGATISDNKIDLSKFTGSELVLTGKYTKGILFVMRPQIQVTFKDAIVDNSTTNETIELEGIYDQVMLWGDGSTKLFGKAGNSASQMIFFKGTWSNIAIGGFEVDQRRNSAINSTVTGASLQFAGVPTKSLGESGNGKVHVYDMIFRNSGDETLYVGHFKKIRDDGVEMADGVELIVERVKAENMGRDFGQQRGFKKVTFKDCQAKNIGLEAHNDHCSGFSLNDGSTEEILLDNCTIENAKQFVYGGSTTKSIKATIRNSKYIQGTHAGTRANSALYLKGPGQWALENSEINAPNVLQAAITADGSQVTYTNCKIVAKDIDRLFNGGTVKEIESQPVVKVTDVMAQLEETTFKGQTTRKLLYDNQEFVLK